MSFITEGIRRRIADQAVRRFTPFAQTTLEQGLPDVSTGLFQNALSCVTDLPPGYLEKREIDGGYVILSETTQAEHHDGVGFEYYPIKWMEWHVPDGREVDVKIVLYPDRYEARIFSRNTDQGLGTNYIKYRKFGAKWQNH